MKTFSLFQIYDFNFTECSFFTKVIDREGYEEFYPRMMKTECQDKRRLMRTCTEQNNRSGKAENVTEDWCQIDALAV